MLAIMDGARDSEETLSACLDEALECINRQNPRVHSRMFELDLEVSPREPAHVQGAAANRWGIKHSQVRANSPPS